MNLIQTQIAYFFKNDYVKDFEWFSLALKEIFGKSVKTLQIPIPENEPSEIPRLTLNYTGFNINVAKNRLDVFILDQGLLDEIKTPITEKVFSKLDINIGRLGYIKTYFKTSTIIEIKRGLNSTLQKKDFKEVNIRVSETIEVNQTSCNSIEKVDFGKATKNNEDGKAIDIEGQIIQRDMNTSSDIDVTFSPSEMLTLLNEFDIAAKTRILNL